MTHDYKFADTVAARMLAGGLARAAAERGLSVRQIGKLLGYKQAVVLSHMANGRVPIPIDRAEDLAGILELDPASFLEAVIEQRHPEVDWNLIKSSAVTKANDNVEVRLETMLSVDPQITAAHRRVIREVLAARSPEARWLTPHELRAMEIIRTHRPAIGASGLSSEELTAIEGALKGSSEV